MTLLKLSLKSLRNRKTTVFLTIFSIAISVCLLLSVERIRQGARESFKGTISQTDLIVGPRGGHIQLLLYSVFRMGPPTGNISYATYEEIKSLEDIAWTIPYSLGDSHRGFRVVGTTSDFYKHYRYRNKNQLEFESGTQPLGLYETAIGSAVAKKLGYKTGQDIILSHGVSETEFNPVEHSNSPFKIVGVLKQTNTPIDRSVYISLQAVTAIHDGFDPSINPLQSSEPVNKEVSGQQSNLHDEFQVEQITAFLLGAKERFQTLELQRYINTYQTEALTAIIPALTLSELWEGLSYGEQTLFVVSVFVILVGFLGMLVSILNSLRERRREVAILRSLGSPPRWIAGLMIAESFLLTLLGVLLGVLITYLLLFIFQPLIEQRFGLYIPIYALSLKEYGMIGFVLLFSIVLGLVPAWQAYRKTLQDGLTIKV